VKQNVFGFWISEIFPIRIGLTTFMSYVWDGREWSHQRPVISPDLAYYGEYGSNYRYRMIVARFS
jgi:hypothetical protein